MPSGLSASRPGRLQDQRRSGLSYLDSLSEVYNRTAEIREDPLRASVVQEKRLVSPNDVDVPLPPVSAPRPPQAQTLGISPGETDLRSSPFLAKSLPFLRLYEDPEIFTAAVQYHKGSEAAARKAFESAFSTFETLNGILAESAAGRLDVPENVLKKVALVAGPLSRALSVRPSFDGSPPKNEAGVYAVLPGTSSIYYWGGEGRVSQKPLTPGDIRNMAMEDRDRTALRVRLLTDPAARQFFGFPGTKDASSAYAKLTQEYAERNAGRLGLFYGGPTPPRDFVAERIANIYADRALAEERWEAERAKALEEKKTPPPPPAERLPSLTALDRGLLARRASWATPIPAPEAEKTPTVTGATSESLSDRFLAEAERELAGIRDPRKRAAMRGAIAAQWAAVRAREAQAEAHSAQARAYETAAEASRDTARAAVQRQELVTQAELARTEAETQRAKTAAELDLTLKDAAQKHAADMQRLTVELERARTKGLEAAVRVEELRAAREVLAARTEFLTSTVGDAFRKLSDSLEREARKPIGSGDFGAARSPAVRAWVETARSHASTLEASSLAAITPKLNDWVTQALTESGLDPALERPIKSAFGSLYVAAVKVASSSVSRAVAEQLERVDRLEDRGHLDPFLASRLRQNIERAGIQAISSAHNLVINRLNKIVMDEVDEESASGDSHWLMTRVSTAAVDFSEWLPSLYTGVKDVISSTVTKALRQLPGSLIDEDEATLE